jgi:hypothetical protein
LVHKMLFGRRVESPGGIRQMRPCQCAKIGSARGNDRVHMIRLVNVAHSDGRNIHLVAQLVGERGLPHAPIDGLLIAHCLAARYVEHIGARLFEGTRDRQ